MRNDTSSAKFSGRSLPVGILLLAETGFLVLVVLAGPMAFWGFVCIAAVNVVCAAFVKNCYWWTPGNDLSSAWFGRTVFVALACLWLLAGNILQSRTRMRHPPKNAVFSGVVPLDRAGRHRPAIARPQSEAQTRHPRCYVHVERMLDDDIDKSLRLAPVPGVDDSDDLHDRPGVGVGAHFISGSLG
jgi:hypothetical protein